MQSNLSKILEIKIIFSKGQKWVVESVWESKCATLMLCYARNYAGIVIHKREIRMSLMWSE